MRQPLIDTISSGITVVTGTDTDAGKTVTTAVLAAALTRRGRDVLAVKPCQTGLAPGEPGDGDPGEHLQPRERVGRAGPPVGLDDADDHVGAPVAAAAPLAEHGDGLAHTGGSAQIDAQSSASHPAIVPGRHVSPARPSARGRG